MTRNNVWPAPQAVDTPTSYRYRPRRLSDRVRTAVCWVAFVLFVGAGLSGCAPQPEGYISATVEYEVLK